MFFKLIFYNFNYTQVNNDVQRVFHKIGDAGKHSAEAAKKGLNNVFNFGKSAENEGENQANNVKIIQIY